MNIDRNYFGHFSMNVYYPEELIADLNEISCFSNEPFSWFIGQFNKHLLKLNNITLNHVNQKISDIKALKPLMG
jgi:hypothetical protein